MLVTTLLFLMYRPLATQSPSLHAHCLLLLDLNMLTEINQSLYRQLSHLVYLMVHLLFLKTLHGDQSQSSPRDHMLPQVQVISRLKMLNVLDKKLSNNIKNAGMT